MTENEVRVCCFCWKHDTLGVVYYDTIFGSFELGSFHPSQFMTLFEKIKSIYIINDFLISFNADDEIVTFLQSDGSANVNIRKNTDFSFTGGLEALKEMTYFVSNEENEDVRMSIASGIVDISSKAVVGAIGAIYQFVNHRNHHNDDNEDDRATTTKFFVSGFKSLKIAHGLYLPKSAAEELQIISYDPRPSIHSNSNAYNDGISLFTLFNRCSTIMGRVTLRNWFLITLDGIDQINNRLDIIESFVQPEMFPYINETISILKTIPELRHLIVKLRKESIDQSQWQKLYKGLNQAASLCQLINSFSLSAFQNETFTILNINTYGTLRSVATEIQSTLDLKNANITVRDDSDPQLRKMREDYSNLDKILTEIAKQVMNDLPDHTLITSLSVVYLPEQGFLTTVSKSSSLMASDLPFNYSLKFESETHYYCKNQMMVELDEKYGDIYNSIMAREIRLLVSLSDKVMKISPLINQVWETIGILDAYFSLSVVAVESHYVRPLITIDEKDLIIENGRHPLLEKFNDHVVPNSTRNMLDNQIHIITGPNSSGKSVYLKQIALIVYLAHIGSFVPADKAIIPMTDYLFCFFQRNNYAINQPFVSSFLLETKNMTEAIQKSTQRSIIIFDEFGKTSNRNDAICLLTSIIKHFYNRGQDCPKIFISTHFNQVFKYLHHSMFVSCVMNVKFVLEKNDEGNDTDSIIFLYQIIQQSSNMNEDDSSFGLHCARRAGLSDDIVDRAEKVARCYDEGLPIQPNEECIDAEFEQKTRKALSLFFKFDSKNGDPKELLYQIENLIETS